VQVPGYIEQEDALKEAGIDEVIIYCVNDGAVMKAWADDQGVDEDTPMISMMGDPSLKFTEGTGYVLDHPGPMSVLGGKRCKRHAMYIDDGVVKYVAVSEGPDDPAGDGDPSASCVDAMLKAIKAL